MAFRSSTTNSGASTTLSVAVPAGAAVDDIMILLGSVDQQAASFTSWPTGFTELDEVDLTGDGQSVAIAWKRLTAADTGTYSIALTGALATPDWVFQAFCFSGRDTGNPPVKSTAATNNSANASPVTITANGVTALAGDDLLFLAACDPFASVTIAFTPPTGYTEQQDTRSGWAAQTGATKDNVSSGATGSVSGTATLGSSTAGWAAWLVRIPAAASGGGSVTAVAATASATAIAPTVSGNGGATVTAVVATATAAAVAPAVSGQTIISGGGPASASAAMVAPAITGGATVTAVVMTASGAAIAPSVAGSSPGGVTAVAMTATAAAVAPVVTGGANQTAVVATASAQSVAPVVGVTVNVNAVVATSSGTLIAPAVSAIGGGSVQVVVATAQLVAYAPAVSPTPGGNRFLFSPPTHEESMRTGDLWLQHFRLTWANSIVWRNGQFVSTRNVGQDEINSLVPGVTYFRGGVQYVVDQATATALAAAGYTATPI